MRRFVSYFTRAMAPARKPAANGGDASTGFAINGARTDDKSDANDSCTLVANADQRETNGDGFGNVCDPDLNGDLVVKFGDLSLLKAAFFTSDADADLHRDGTVSFADLGIRKASSSSPRDRAAARSSRGALRLCRPASRTSARAFDLRGLSLYWYRVGTVHPHPVLEELRPHACRASIFRCQGRCR
jgi:hypothetical protein